MVRLNVVHDYETLTAAALRRDPLASRAARTVQQFDRFLARHDAPGAARIPDGYTVDLAPAEPNAHGGADEIQLGGPVGVFTRSFAEFPDVVGHELAHGVEQRTELELGSWDEGWPDAVGAAFARSIGQGNLDGRLGEGILRANRSGRTWLRDTVHPRIHDVRGLHREVHRLDRRGYLIEPHEVAGLITRPAALAAAQLGHAQVDRIYLRAFLHHLPDSTPFALAKAEHDAESSAHPLTHVHDALLRTSAEATVTAATELWKGSRQADAMRDAWRQVGVDDL